MVGERDREGEEGKETGKEREKEGGNWHWHCGADCPVPNFNEGKERLWH